MEIFFEEKQKFNQWWIWIILLFCSISVIIPAMYDKTTSNISLPLFILAIAIPLMFYFFELRTFVTKEGLYYQFFPIHFKKHLIRLNEIEKIEAVKYNPLIDYGGWGIRYRFSGKAYNVSGKEGVKVYLKNNKHILFGSQRFKELAMSLKKLKEQ